MIIKLVSQLIYILFYSILTSLSMGIFLIFQPFAYVDNNQSTIYCIEKNTQHQIGPNFIYTFSSSFDSYNDSKAKKICEYSIIRDYYDAYPKPVKNNYKLNIVYTKESSLPEAFFASVIFFLAGSCSIEVVRKIILLMIGNNSTSIGSSLFNFLLYLIS